jgi:hypothetical protein
MRHESTIAIIGDGPAALATLAVLRHAGAESLAVYGTGPHPLANLERYANSVHQGAMRSEGDGHLSPAGFPDLALLDSLQRRSPLPALASLFNLYVPSLEFLLEHAARVARRYDFEGCRVPARIGTLARAQDRSGGFELFDEAGAAVGTARHVVLALGHPGLRWPPGTSSWRFHPLVSHAYQSPRFTPGERVAVVGGGMAAAHTWLAALDAGATVVALHRNPLRRQQLNAPRAMFSAAGLDAYRRLGPEERQARLQAVAGSYALRGSWELRLGRARRAGRLEMRQGAFERLSESGDLGRPLTLHLAGGDTLAVDRVVFATGFRTDACDHALVRHLVRQEGARYAHGLLRPEDDFTIPPLSRPDSILAVVGTLARWALPVADTFFGMKYAARRIAPLITS